MAAPTPNPKIGDRFGRLTVLSDKRVPEGKRYLVFKVRCDCGTEKEVEKGALIEGKTVSCGCYSKEATGDRSRTHGKRSSPIYAVWNMMKQRCNLPTNKGYKDYGARGIRLCEEWETFENFYNDMKDPPFKGASLERIDSNGHYCKENVKWATREEQANNKRNSVRFTFEGAEYSVKELALKFNMNPNTLCSRLYSQRMSVEEAVTKPIMTNSQSAELSYSGVGRHRGRGRIEGHKLYGEDKPEPRQPKCLIIDNIEIPDNVETL